MATQQLSLTTACSPASSFRAWGLALSNALATAGFVKTADTGQIDWTAVTAPASGSIAGYEVWRFADALQATAPIFFKLSYGSGTNTATPQILIAAGTGSDGAGTLTGTNIAGVSGAVTNNRTATPTTTSAVGATGPVFVGSDGSTLCLGLWPNLIVNGFCGGIILLERTRAWDGTATGDGFILLTAYSGATSDLGVSLSQICYVPGGATNNGTPNVTSGIAYPGNSSSTSAVPNTCVVNNVLYPFPLPTTSGPRCGGPSQYVMVIGRGDYGAAQTFAMNHYGVSRNWYTYGPGGNVSGFGPFGPGNLSSLIMRVS